ncbi:MAG TPA: type 1 glutamine amidotransferase [Candidatus Desulfofervidus auxilii]|uniref:Type 1 glutamine amidotransferase n=1 Tax=Desulfofervidus auxilii TaxID=1621989 RepID=A0A7C0U3P1_DESA2|nr:type 1 glutamine amidotransferase [Candidatus Desulfofervidus auxilii]
MTKKVAILVADIYQDLEVWYPLLRLKEIGIEVIVVGPEKGKIYKGKYGYPIKSEVNAKEVKTETLDGIIIPGGYAPDILRRYPEIVDLVKKMYQEGKVVAAICHGGWLLCSAKILNGKTVTGFFAIKDDLENAGAKFIDAEVVVDGNLITSRQPEDLPMFVLEIIRALKV